MEDRNKPATGYPTGYNQAQPSYDPNGYPPAQSSYSATTTATGTGYPYAAPPPAVYYNPNPYSTPFYDQRRTAFLRRLISLMVVVFLIMAGITFIMWLIIRPHLPEFRLNSASVSSFNVNATQVTGDWNLDFTVRNPNKKMSVYYDHIESTFYYRGAQLSDTFVAPFSQGKKNETTMQVKFAAASQYVPESSAKALASDRSSGEVGFNVRIWAWVWFKCGGWRTRMHYLRVFCDNVKIGFSSNRGVGVLSGGPTNCKVYL
ncbi:PREDICTED: protein YLS9-like [Nelumbo nucifera]|nr:PREDICTED: protein YLS9-like [Nelumbo nucifera]